MSLEPRTSFILLWGLNFANEENLANRDKLSRGEVRVATRVWVEPAKITNVYRIVSTFSFFRERERGKASKRTTSIVARVRCAVWLERWSVLCSGVFLARKSLLACGLTRANAFLGVPNPGACFGTSLAV